MIRPNTLPFDPRALAPPVAAYLAASAAAEDAHRRDLPTRDGHEHAALMAWGELSDPQREAVSTFRALLKLGQGLAAVAAAHRPPNKASTAFWVQRLNAALAAQDARLQRTDPLLAHAA